MNRIMQYIIFLLLKINLAYFIVATLRLIKTILHVHFYNKNIKNVYSINVFHFKG